MGRFIRALFRSLGRSFDRFWALGIPFPGFHMPVDAGQEEARQELDFAAPGEPQEHLPHSDLSEQQRREAVRQHQHELREKGRR